MQNLQQPQQGSRLAPEFNRRLADGSIPLPTAVGWWQEEWRVATLNGEDISTEDLSDAEFAAFGIGFYDRAINEAAAYETAAYEIDKQRCWAELEQARQALRS